MARPVQLFHFTYDDLVRITGLDRKTVWKHHDRGYFDPEKLETVVMYLIRRASKDIRTAYAQEATRMSHEPKTILPRVPRKPKTSPDS